MTDLPMSFPLIVAQHRRWLRARGLLARPWLILGAAPQPSLPADRPADLVHAYVKLAGRSAAKLGLPPADLTFLPRKVSGPALDGLTLGNVLWMGRGLTFATKLRRLVGHTRSAECDMTNGDRDRYILRTLGSLFAGEGNDARPSNGVALVCFAIAVGVPRIIVAGISLESDGYEYDPAARTRRHVPQDRAALREIAKRYPQVVTTEPGLHRLTGLPLLAS
ncbi:hypothetical protein [Mangrovicella endophytica]|uniref:hypothetical protein n=1 Tax=Mangrovicella endophytica TaxID=2066697 RepID=UPI000C9DC189|nr:hypothetical protein [Mangrovicella endophytica]